MARMEQVKSPRVDEAGRWMMAAGPFLQQENAVKTH